ncbi:hypothetical protein DMN57_01190 [Escherichia coli]|nr:hypothetical protein [Escherichia coli]
MLVTLAAMLGQIGTPGGGFGFSYHYSNGGNRRVLAAYCQKCLRRLPDRQVRKLMMAE